MNLSASDDENSSEELSVPHKKRRISKYESSSEEFSVPHKKRQISKYEAPFKLVSYKSDLNESKESMIKKNYESEKNKALSSEDSSSSGDDARPKFQEEFSENASHKQFNSQVQLEKDKVHDANESVGGYSETNKRIKLKRGHSEGKSLRKRGDVIVKKHKSEKKKALSSEDSSSSSDDARTKFQEAFSENASHIQFDRQAQLEKEKVQDANEVVGGYSETTKRMMLKMGYSEGKGLGKREDGITAPVEASNQKGRRGLGMQSDLGKLPNDFKWKPDDSKPVAEEHVDWMAPSTYDLTKETLKQWLHIGPKKLTIDDEVNFVDPSILKGVLNAKTMFDNMGNQEFLYARHRSNPYETIGSAIFLNRAAVKMANIDAVFDFMFTNANKKSNKKDNNQIDDELLYFADICAGPGGFSEYILFRKNWIAKGFGFTLKGPNDFKLSDFCAGTPETFQTFYGVKGDGDIFSTENLDSLKAYIMAQTNNEGVHFVMADGGFSVEGQENIQEILSKQLYLCQCLAALMIVRVGGHFVVKLFDVYTMFSVGLIYIMHKCFEKVSIHKPVTSRPANSERYLICKSKRDGTHAAEEHLRCVNIILNENKNRDNSDVLELVPVHVIKEDQLFYEYIYKSNCLIGEKQIKNLLKIAAFSENKNLKEDSQNEMRVKCLDLWQIPNEVRKRAAVSNADEILNEILTLIKKKPHDMQDAPSFKKMIANSTQSQIYLKSELTLKRLEFVHNWYFQVLGSNFNNRELRFFIGCGGKRVYYLNQNTWKDIDKNFVELPAKTLFYGEVVKECKGEGGNQMRTKALHIIDALVLGGIDISYLPLSKRIDKCNMFCSALEKYGVEHNELSLRCKSLYTMTEFPVTMERLYVRSMKDIGRAWTYNIPNSKDQFHAVGSLIFINELKEPWNAHMSQTYRQKYYYREYPKRSEFFLPEEASLDAFNAYLSNIIWPEDCPFSAVYEDRVDAVSRKTIENMLKCK